MVFRYDQCGHTNERMVIQPKSTKDGDMNERIHIFPESYAYAFWIAEWSVLTEIKPLAFGDFVKNKSSRRSLSMMSLQIWPTHKQLFWQSFPFQWCCSNPGNTKSNWFIMYHFHRQNDQLVIAGLIYVGHHGVVSFGLTPWVPGALYAQVLGILVQHAQGCMWQGCSGAPNR